MVTNYTKRFGSIFDRRPHGFLAGLAQVLNPFCFGDSSDVIEDLRSGDHDARAIGDWQAVFGDLNNAFMELTEEGDAHGHKTRW